MGNLWLIGLLLVNSVLCFVTEAKSTNFEEIEIGKWIKLPAIGQKAVDRVGWQKVVFDEKNNLLWISMTATNVDGGTVSYSNDAWGYNPTSNQWKELFRHVNCDAGYDKSQIPSCRHAEGGRAYNSRLGVMMLYGCSANQKLFDTWIFDNSGGGWQRVHPGPRSSGVWVEFEHQIEYDRARDLVIHFGGNVNTSASNEVNYFIMDTSGSGHWTRPNVNGPKPPPRHWHVMAYDSRRKEMVVFGGGSAFTGGTYFNDLWAYNAGTHTWREIVASGVKPKGVMGASWDYDSVNDVFMLHGGGSGSGDKANSFLVKKTWIFDPNTLAWTEITDTAGPSFSNAGDYLAFDRNHGVFLFFERKSSDVWAYRYSELAVDNTPPDPPTNVHVVE